MASHQYNLRPRRSPASPAASTRCRLLELPAELRNRIYGFALVQATPIHITESTNDPGGWQEFPERTNPPLSSACRQVRAEALGMFYGLNVFQSILARSFSNWLTAMGSENVRMVKQIRGYSAEPRLDIEEAQGLACGYVRHRGRGKWNHFDLADGVFRVAFTDAAHPDMNLWTAARSSIIYASKKDIHTVATFKIESENPLRMVPM